MNSKQGICNGCGQPINWIKTAAGKWMPIDTEITVSDGTDLLYVDEITGFKKLEAGRKGYKSHFSTCPDAKKFRKGK